MQRQDQIGERWLHHGVGVVTVVTIAPDGGLEVTDVDDDRFDVDAADRDYLLRPIISAAQAEQARELLVEPPATFSQDPTSKRAYRYTSAYEDGTFEEHVEMLRAMYHDQRDEPAEASNRPRFESLILHELAIALDVSYRSLRGEITRSVGVGVDPADLLPDRTAELANAGPLPDLPGFHSLGAFYVENEIGAGADGCERTLPAAPGIWFAYCRVDVSLFAIHAASNNPLTSAAFDSSGFAPVGDPVGVEGATLVIADAVAARSKGFHEALGRSDAMVAGGRAAQLHLGGDGSCQVSHRSVDGAAIAVVVVSLDPDVP